MSLGVLTELALKFIYNMGELGANDLSAEMHLPFSGVVQGVLQLLDREELVNITGSGGFGERAYRLHADAERHRTRAPSVGAQSVRGPRTGAVGGIQCDDPRAIRWRAVAQRKRMSKRHSRAW